MLLVSAWSLAVVVVVYVVVVVVVGFVARAPTQAQYSALCSRATLDGGRWWRRQLRVHSRELANPSRRMHRILDDAQDPLASLNRLIQLELSLGLSPLVL